MYRTFYRILYISIYDKQNSHIRNTSALNINLFKNSRCEFYVARVYTIQSSENARRGFDGEIIRIDREKG